MDGQDEILTLVDEEGEEHRFGVIDFLHVNEKDYAVLFPLDTDQEAEDGEAVIFRVESEGEGDQALAAVDDEEEWEMVAAAWEDRIREWEGEEEEDGTFLDDEDEGA